MMVKQLPIEEGIHLLRLNGFWITGGSSRVVSWFSQLMMGFADLIIIVAPHALYGMAVLSKAISTRSGCQSGFAGSGLYIPIPTRPNLKDESTPDQTRVLLI